jgi:hypothetical protein
LKRVEVPVPFINEYGVGGPVKIPPVVKGNADTDRVVVFVVLIVVVEFFEITEPVRTGRTVTVVVPTTVLPVGV